MRIKKPEIGRLNLKAAEQHRMWRSNSQADDKNDPLKYFISSTRSNRVKFNGHSKLLQGLYDYLDSKPSDQIVRKIDYYYSPYSQQFSTQRYMTFGDEGAKQKLNKDLVSSKLQDYGKLISNCGWN